MILNSKLILYFPDTLLVIVDLSDENDNRPIYSGEFNLVRENTVSQTISCFNEIFISKILQFSGRFYNRFDEISV